MGFVSHVVYIQENVSTLNILVGVLCNTLVHSPELQKSIESLGLKEDALLQQELLDVLQVPSTTEELLEYLFGVSLMVVRLFANARRTIPMLPSRASFSRFPSTCLLTNTLNH